MERKKAHNVSSGLKGHGGAFCYSWESFKTVNNAAEKYSNIKKKTKNPVLVISKKPYTPAIK